MVFELRLRAIGSKEGRATPRFLLFLFFFFYVFLLSLARITYRRRFSLHAHAVSNSHDPYLNTGRQY